MDVLIICGDSSVTTFRHLWPAHHHLVTRVGGAFDLSYYSSLRPLQVVAAKLQETLGEDVRRFILMNHAECKRGERIHGRPVYETEHAAVLRYVAAKIREQFSGADVDAYLLIERTRTLKMISTAHQVMTFPH